MNLEEKFREVIPKNDYNHENKTVDKCVQICDDFAVGFAEWLKDNCYEHNGFWYRNHEVNMLVYTTTELLEIYKQGL